MNVKSAIVIATNEPVNVYMLHGGTYYDYDAMGEDKPPTATKSGKKEFNKKELKFN